MQMSKQLKKEKKHIEVIKEKLRIVAYPLEITDQVWTAENDGLQAHYIKKRYTALEIYKSSEIARLKRNFKYSETTLWEHWRQDRWEALREPAERVAAQYGIKYGKDLHVLMLGIHSNLEYAKIRDNPYLLREGVHAFPTMNYLTGDGPRKFHNHDEFGPEDYHCIVQGFHKQLFFFQPEIHGLEKGWFVAQRGRP